MVAFAFGCPVILGNKILQRVQIEKMEPEATSGLEFLQVPSSITFLDDDAGTPETSDEEVPETEVSDDPTSDAMIHPAKVRRRSTSESMASASTLTLVLSLAFNLCFGGV